MIHFRKGKIMNKTSGQAATCFKRWRDSVFIIPTSLKEIVFQANQLTSDNVDVRIRGMAVYRINDPLKIYKLINFSNRQAAESKLARMISDMCRSTAKWLVANMEVHECVRKRKEEIAESLKKEVSLVVANEESGWGIEIITIDIQDIYIQDNEIFRAMQMLFKTGKLQESKTAELEMENDLETKKLKSERELAEHRKATKLEQARIEAEILEEQIKLAKKNDEKQFELDHYRVEQNEKIANYKLEQEIAKERQRMELMLEKTQKEVQAKKIINQEEIDSLRAKIEIENSARPISLEKYFIEKSLPDIARSVAESMHGANIHIFQQDGKSGSSPFQMILMELMQIFAIE